MWLLCQTRIFLQGKSLLTRLYGRHLSESKLLWDVVALLIFIMMGEHLVRVFINQRLVMHLVRILRIVMLLSERCIHWVMVLGEDGLIVRRRGVLIVLRVLMALANGVQGALRLVLFQIYDDVLIIIIVKVLNILHAHNVCTAHIGELLICHSEVVVQVLTTLHELVLLKAF